MFTDIYRYIDILRMYKDYNSLLNDKIDRSKL